VTTTADYPLGGLGWWLIAAPHLVNVFKHLMSPLSNVHIRPIVKEHLHVER